MLLFVYIAPKISMVFEGRIVRFSELELDKKSEKINCAEQGCQIFIDIIYQCGEKYTKNIKNYQMALKYSKWP
jgi:hypothetical protein